MYVLVAPVGEPGATVGNVTVGTGRATVAGLALGLTTIRLGGMIVEVDEIGVGYARTEIPSLIRASARTGRAFHIRNAKNPEAASALLVSPGALEQLVFAPVRRRKLSEVLDLLPFKHTGAERVRAGSRVSPSARLTRKNGNTGTRRSANR